MRGTSFPRYREGSPLTISHTADQIDKHNLEIAQADDETYTSMRELAEELPDHSPRYILLSYPLTLVCYARLSRLDAIAHSFPAVGQIISPLRAALLFTRDLQLRKPYAVCRRQGTHEKHGRSGESH